MARFERYRRARKFYQRLVDHLVESNKFKRAVEVANVLRLDPVTVLRDPSRENYYLRLSAASVIWTRQEKQRKETEKQIKAKRKR